jgi:hypothetical protein
MFLVDNGIIPIYPVLSNTHILFPIAKKALHFSESTATASKEPIAAENEVCATNFAFSLSKTFNSLLNSRIELNIISLNPGTAAINDSFVAAKL